MEERLHKACGTRAARDSTVILVGLGGAGKSQLALDYIHQDREEYSAVFSVDARLPESLEPDYVQTYCLHIAAGRKQLPSSSMLSESSPLSSIGCTDATADGCSCSTTQTA